MSCTSDACDEGSTQSNVPAIVLVERFVGDWGVMLVSLYADHDLRLSRDAT